MTALGIDLGGTKLSMAVFSPGGDILAKHTAHLEKREGKAVADLLIDSIQQFLLSHPGIQSVGIAVPGIYRKQKGTVWAPNIKGWDDYPLLEQLNSRFKFPVIIDSDRAAYISGETWKGNAKGCRNAIYLAVGTGIGAGIMVDGNILRGEHDIAGAIGWMALKPPYEEKFVSCGCYEYHASGDGIARVARDMLQKNDAYNGKLRKIDPSQLSAHHVFDACDAGDHLAIDIMQTCIQFWGMSIANLVSLFDPAKIILGGGVFGPAVSLIPQVIDEANKWAQPVSMKLVSVEPSALGPEAGLFGAGKMALEQLNKSYHVQ